MKKQFAKNSVVLGKFIVISALFIIAVRSYTIDTFEGYEFKTMLPPAGEIIEPDKEKFFFSVISDTGARDEILESILRKISATDAAFILYLGDMVRYRNPSHFRWMSEEIYSELDEKPFYVIPGNHDIIPRGGTSDRNLYTSFYGQPYYWFAYGKTLFIGLDSAESKYDDKQLEWLKFVLAKIRPFFNNCIIYSHVPPTNPILKNRKILTKESRLKFADAIKGRNVNLLLSGHVHLYSESEFEGIPLITVPTSGQHPRGDVKDYGYVNVYVNSSEVENIEVNYIDKIEDTTDYIELFFSSAIVKKEIAHYAMLLFIFGILLIAAGKVLKSRK